LKSDGFSEDGKGGSLMMVMATMFRGGWGLGNHVGGIAEENVRVKDVSASIT
jgi:hypothetical protein